MGAKDIVPVFYLFTVGCDDRDQLASHLAANGVYTAVHHSISSICSQCIA